MPCRSEALQVVDLPAVADSDLRVAVVLALRVVDLLAVEALALRVAVVLKLADEPVDPVAWAVRAELHSIR